MAQIMISLRMIQAHNPCLDGWVKILHARGAIDERQMMMELDQGEALDVDSTFDLDQTFPLSEALESNGLADTLWALRCLPQYDNLWRKYAVWCARQVQHLMGDQRSIDALEIAWRYSNGEATDEQLAAARDAAWDAARAAAWDAAGAAARDVAGAAARDVAGAAARDVAGAAARDVAGAAGAAKLLEILNAGEWIN